MGRNRVAVLSMSLCMTLVLCLTSLRIARAQDFEVDSQGAFNYKYELKLPPGTNGMGPGLTLAYNSNNGNGILGMGWSLVGLPAIVRDPVYGINYTNEDHYLYNGEKLVPGSDGYYHTERESFVRIEASYLNSASSYWVVILKNGTRMYFGDQTGNGHIDAVGKAGKAYAWALSKVIDIHGNYYEVEYHEDTENGDYYPVRITYTKNDEQPLKAYRTVEFSYEIRTDHGPMYNFSAKVDTDKRLKWITVKVGENLLRKYRLDYEYGTATGRSRLIAIQEYGSDGNVPPVPWVDGSFAGTGKVLPKVEFEWLEGYNGVFTSVYGSRNGIAGYGLEDVYDRAFSFDYNGDGKQDIFLYRHGRGSGEGWVTVARSNGDGTFTSVYGGRNGIAGYGLEDEYDNAFPFDYNGDGKQDLFFYRHGRGSGEGWVTVAKSNGDGTFTSVYGGRYGIAGYGLEDVNDRVFPFDYNGDGKQDLFFYRHGRGSGEGWVTVARSNGDGTFTSVYGSRNGIAGYGLEDVYDNAFPFDYNGDGKQDIFLYRHGRGSGEGWVTVARSNGDGTFTSVYGSRNGIAGYGLEDVYDNAFPFDYNGDGKQDIFLYRHGRGSGEGWVTIAESDGPNTDLLNIISNGSNGNKEIITIDFTSASQVPGTVVPESKTYPNITNSNPVSLVIKIIDKYGLGNGTYHITTNTYNYSNNIFHLGLPHERVNLGFEWIEKTDSSGVSVKTYYRQDDVDYRGLAWKEETYGSDHKRYLEKQFKYAKQVIKDNGSDPDWHSIKFIYCSDEYTYNYNGEDGTPVEYHTGYKYDGNGNRIEIINQGDTAVTSDDTRTVTEYTEDVSARVTLPAVIRNYGCDLAGVQGLASETRFFYTDYLLTRKEFENGNQDAVLKYGYDTYGNLVTETDGNGNTGTIAYDPVFATNIVSVVNALGHAKQTEYDALMRPAKTIDPNGAVWETVYDEFSREKATVAPGDAKDNPTTKIAYPDEFADSAGALLFPLRMKVSQKESGNNYLDKYEYYDGLGRVIQQKTEAKNGWITIDHYYDNAGREYKTSIPYVTADFVYSEPDAAVKYTFKEFDPMGREVRVQNTDNTVTQKIYQKCEVISVDPSLHVTSKKQAGNVQEERSYTGVYPDHNLYATVKTQTARDGIRITDVNGNILESKTDLLGRKVSYSDPDMGLWTYAYDGNHNVVSQKDAKTQTIKMEYDAINRLIKKTCPDGSTVKYYYDEAGHGYGTGRLTRIEYPGGEESYTYDARGRKTAVTQIIDGLSRTQKIAYDSMDRTVSQTYPDGEVVKYNYDQSGNLSSLAGNITYVAAVDYTPFGKVSRIQYGNGIQTVYDYYDAANKYDSSAASYFSYRLKQIHVFGAGNEIFNLGYEYDKADNVKVKRDLTQSNFTEEYSYDDLNRLIGSGSTAYGYKLFRYDKLNNITEKDLHTYQYQGTQPHAVTNDGNFTYTYDANGNMLTRSDGRKFTWNYENKLTAISDGGSFSYNPAGRRIKKTENGISTYYFFPNYEEEYQAGKKSKTVKHYFVNQQRVAEDSSADGIRYYHQDHLGSSVALTNTGGSLVYRANYAPYGSDAYAQGSSTVKYKFTGQEKDQAGLYYYGARYYDPELGRFISPDVNLDGLNRYTYCQNNPVLYNDPTGEWAWLVGAIVGAYTGHVAAEAKGVEIFSGDWWSYVATGAAIGGIAGYAGESITTWATNVAKIGAGIKDAAIASSINVGIGGTVGGFISGFGNSWAFGGEGTDLFKGDLMGSLVNGSASAAYGFLISGGLKYMSQKYKFDIKEYLKFRFENSAGEKISLNFKNVEGILKDFGVSEQSITDIVNSLNKNVNEAAKHVFNTIIEASYNSCSIVNDILIKTPNAFGSSESGLNQKAGKIIFGGILRNIDLRPIIWDRNTRENIPYREFAFDLTEISYKYSF